MGFGDFSSQCAQAALPLCKLIGPQSPLTGTTGIQAKCYSRSVDVANTLIFQGVTGFVHILALLMTIIMIVHVKSKYTAVGRKEITAFFYIYIALTCVSLILDTGVIPAKSSAFAFFAAAQNGLSSALTVCLLVNGFVGFQLYEDGTTLSVWLLYGVSFSMFIICGAVSLLTFKSWAGLGPRNTIGMFVVLYIFNLIFVAVYIIMQFILVINTLQDRWPIGDLIFGCLFFIIGQVIMYGFGAKICEAASHYLDGLFFASVCNLLAVMMVYKYWDSITREDFEFSVGIKQNNWDMKAFFPVDDDRRNTAHYQPQQPASALPPQQPHPPQHNNYHHPQQQQYPSDSGYTPSPYTNPPSRHGGRF